MVAPNTNIGISHLRIQSLRQAFRSESGISRSVNDNFVAFVTPPDQPCPRTRRSRRRPGTSPASAPTSRHTT